MFSRASTSLHGPRNALYTLRDSLAAAGLQIDDLVSGNVHEHGVCFPQSELQAIMADALDRTRRYTPDPLGRRNAREAIAAYYAGRGIPLSPDQVVLTPGTSVAYWYAFQLLADPGDEILAPRPSYPLFEYIAALSGVRMIPYRMVERRRWQVDVEHLEACLSTRTRAIVLISPHNPTGRVVTGPELEAIAEIARRHDLAVVSDEVFSEFCWNPGPLPRAAAHDAPLVLTLNGFSKMLALPGIKLGWMAVSGAPQRVAEAMRVLELVSDTFLPVGEPVQSAVPALLEAGRRFVPGYAAALGARAARAQALLASSRRLSWVPPDGGSYLTLALDDIPEDQAAEALLRAGLLVHPGHFYDTPADHLIVSTVQSDAVAARAFPLLVETLDALAG